MTTKEQIVEISKQMKELRQKRAHLIGIRKTESEFKVGERVKVYDRYGAEEVYLGEAFVDEVKVNGQDGDFLYQFSQIKKDGTPSVFKFPTQGKVRLEKSKTS